MLLYIGGGLGYLVGVGIARLYGREVFDLAEVAVGADATDEPRHLRVVRYLGQG